MLLLLLSLPCWFLILLKKKADTIFFWRESFSCAHPRQTYMWGNRTNKAFHPIISSDHFMSFATNTTPIGANMPIGANAPVAGVNALQDYRATAAAKHAAWLASQTAKPSSTSTTAPTTTPTTTTTTTVVPASNGGGEGVRYIYVLLCSGGKYYVGETHNVEERFAQHLAASVGKPTASCLSEKESTLALGPGAAWTRKHEPIEVVKKFVKQSVHDEDNTTLDYMVEHGIRNVRGGSFCMVKLPRHIRRTIKQQLATIKKLCYRCKQPGHCANACPSNPNSTTAKPVLPSQKRSWIDYDSEEDEDNSSSASTTTSGHNPLFSFDAKSNGSSIGSSSSSSSSTSSRKETEEDERLRAPRPQAAPERLMDFDFDADTSSRRPASLRYLPKTAPLPPQICARCGRNNHSEYQCFAKNHLRGHLLPPR